MPSFDRFFRLAVVSCCALLGAPLDAQVAGVDERAERYLDGYMMNNEGERLEKAGQLEEALRKFREAAQVFDMLAKNHPGWETNMLGTRRRKVEDSILRVQAAMQRPQQPAPALQNQTPAANAAVRLGTPSVVGGDATAASGPPAVGSWGNDAARSAMGAATMEMPSLAEVFRQYEAQVKEKMDALHQRNIEMERDLRKWEDWYRWASQEIRIARSEKDALGGKLATMEQSLEQLRGEVEAGRASQDQLDTLLKERTALLALEKQNNQRLAAAEAKVSEATAKLAETTRQLEGITKERDRLKEERDAAIAERDAATQDKVNAENRLAEMKERPDAAEAEKLARENLQLKEELAAARASLAETRAEGEQTAAMIASENEVLRNIILRQLRNQARQQQVRAEVTELVGKLSNAPARLLEKIRELDSARLILTEAEEKLFTDSHMQEVAKTGPGVVQATLMASGDDGETNSVDADAQSDKMSGSKPINAILEEAATALGSKDYPAAIERFREALARQPDNTEIMISLGDAHLRAGQYAEVEKVLGLCLARNPNNADALHVLGMAYFRDGKLDKAAKAFQDAAKHDPKQALPHHYLGIIASRQNERERAEQEFRKALEINPKFGEAHFNLAVLYASATPPEWEKARSEYENALGKGVPPDQNLEKLLKQ